MPNFGATVVIAGIADSEKDFEATIKEALKNFDVEIEDGPDEIEEENEDDDEA